MPKYSNRENRHTTPLLSSTPRKTRLGENKQYRGWGTSEEQKTTNNEMYEYISLKKTSEY
jgi:hypothetical protein